MNNPLIGKVLSQIKIAEDKEALLFVFEDGTSLKVLCDADCCSHTWVEHIEIAWIR